MRSTFNIHAFFFVLLTVSVSAQKAADPNAGQGYLIGPGDVLSIKALGEPSFDIEALTVDEDGVILLPFAESPLIAKCKTERGLQADVIKVWSKYLKNPQISLHVAKRNSRPPVSIGGEVLKQQTVDLTRRATLLELISFSGGETEKSGGIVQVYRTRAPLCAKPGDPNIWVASAESDVTSRQYSLTEVRKGGSDANPEIIPGDIIVVRKASPVYVIGEVTKPGEVGIPEGGLLLTQALAMASGVNRDAKTNNIRIRRQKNGMPEPEVLAINYDEIRKGLQKDIQLFPNDIVEVGKAPKKFTDYLLDFVVGATNRVPIAF